MITFHDKASNLHMENQFSIHSFLAKHFYHSQYYENYHLDRSNQLIILDNVGHAKLLNACTLLHYPVLNKQLRKHNSYPVCRAAIDISGYPADKSIQGTIKGLQQLENDLKLLRTKKSMVDSEVNNMIMLLQHDRVTPIYNGSKKRFTKLSDSKIHRHVGTQVRISGIRFFFTRDTSYLSHKSCKKYTLYTLSEYSLLAGHRNYSGRASQLDNPDLACIEFMGGLINTPILAFRCKRSYRHKGRIYYLNLHTSELYSKWSEAQSYADTF